jgi:hypothetical protein
MATRRRRGEDGISFEHRGACRDPQRHRHCPGLWRGELTMGYTVDGKRQRRKVSATTKAAVLDKLRDLHRDLDQGIVPKAGQASYTVRQAAGDWLANGLEGRSAKTIKKNQNVLEPILNVIGARKLRELTAAEVRQALSKMAAGYSAAAVSMGHLASSAPSGTPKPTIWSPATSPPWSTRPRGRKAGRHGRSPWPRPSRSSPRPGPCPRPSCARA